MEDKILDIAHISFLEMIRAMNEQVGPASTKGTLLRIAVKAGGKLAPADFPSLDAFVNAAGDVTNPVTKIEGKAVHVGDGVFGLPHCPFAASISNFKSVFGSLPETFVQVTNEYNKPTPITDELRVGNGAGVSPFCSVHQPMRAAAGKQITIGGKPIVIYQLGCKSGSGAKGFAERWIAEFGCPKDVVDKVLDTNMCCYGVKVAA